MLLVLPHAALFVELAVDVPLDGADPSLLVLLDFELSEPFLLQDYLVLHLVVLFGLLLDLLASVFELDLDGLGLLGLLSLRQVDGLLDLTLLILPLLLEHVVALARHLLRLDIHLEIHDFLK